MSMHTVDPIPVEVVAQSFQAEREVAAEYGLWSTYQIPNTVTQNNLASAGNRPSPILNQDKLRYKAIIRCFIPQNATSVNAATTAAGGGTASLPANSSLTGFTFSQNTATSAAATIVVSNVAGGPITYNLPVGFVGTYTISYAGGLPFSGGAPTVTVSAYTGGSAGNLVVTGFTGNPLTGYVTIGNLRQIQNGQGGQIQSGAQLTMDNQEELYCISDGVNNAVVSVCNQRYANSKITPDSIEFAK